MASPNERQETKRNGNIWTSKLLAVVLGALAASAIAWNYSQLDSIRISSAQNNTILSNMLEVQKAQQQQMGAVIDTNNHQQNELQALKVNQDNMMRFLNEFERRLLSDGKPGDR